MSHDSPTPAETFAALPLPEQAGRMADLLAACDTPEWHPSTTGGYHRNSTIDDPPHGPAIWWLTWAAIDRQWMLSADGIEYAPTWHDTVDLSKEAAAKYESA